MVYQKIFVLEQLLKEDTNSNKKKLQTLDYIKLLLAKLDNKAEMVPANNAKKLSILLSLLKGKPLNRQEKRIVMEIVNG